MNLSQKQPSPLDRVEQWNLCHRLQELGIPYTPDEIPMVGTAIQVWCAARAVVASRQEQIVFLQQCWRLRHEP